MISPPVLRCSLRAFLLGVGGCAVPPRCWGSGRGVTLREEERRTRQNEREQLLLPMKHGNGHWPTHAWFGTKFPPARAGHVLNENKTPRCLYHHRISEPPIVTVTNNRSCCCQCPLLWWAALQAASVVRSPRYHARLRSMASVCSTSLLLVSRRIATLSSVAPASAEAETAGVPHVACPCPSLPPYRLNHSEAFVIYL